MVKRLTIAAFMVAMFGATLAAFAPLGRSCGVSGGGPERCVGTSTFEVDGVGVFSIGLFFVPAALLMTVASAMRDPRPAFAPG